jgi:hypothetical protein
VPGRNGELEAELPPDRLGPANHAALLAMLAKIAQDF